MKNRKRFFSMLSLFILSLTSALTASAQSRSLVLYYSQTSSTRTVAEELQRLTGADIESFDVTEPYDGDYKQTIDRCKDEMSRDYTPTLVPLKSDLAKYDTLYVGYPVWFGTYAPPVKALLATVCLDGKTIVPFCTFGSGGLSESVSHMRTAVPGARVLDGFGIRQARISKVARELPRYLTSIGVIPGNVPALPDFTAQKKPSKAEKQLFDEACGSYPMPLGKPETVGHRQTEDGTEYLFTVKMTRPDGQTMKAKIYVLDPCAPEEKAEFTLVVR